MDNTIAIKEANNGFDAYWKKIFSHPKVVSWMIHFHCEEFKDYSVEDICSKYLCYDEENVPARVTGIESRIYIKGDAYIELDKLYKVRLPGPGDDYIYFNIEAQTAIGSLEELIDRNTVYVAGLVVNQKNIDFTGTKYKNLRNIYTVWIVIFPTRKMECVALNERPALSIDNPNVKFELPETLRNRIRSSFIFLSDYDDKRNQKEQRLISSLIPSLDHLEEKKRILWEEFGLVLEAEEKEMMEIMDWVGPMMRRAEEQAERRKEKEMLAKQQAKEAQMLAKHQEREAQMLAKQQEEKKEMLAKQQEEKAQAIINVMTKYKMSMEDVFDLLCISKNEYSMYKRLVESKVSY